MLKVGLTPLGGFATHPAPPRGTWSGFDNLQINGKEAGDVQVDLRLLW